MKNVAVMSCALSSARIRGTPTSGPYDWWLMGVIRSMAEMSVVSMGASASMSKVRHAAALTPAGQVTGTGAAALLTRSAPVAGSGRAAGPAAARSALVIRASGGARDGTGSAMLDTGNDPNRDRCGQSDRGVNLRRVLIPWYERRPAMPPRPGAWLRPTLILRYEPGRARPGERPPSGRGEPGCR